MWDLLSCWNIGNNLLLHALFRHFDILTDLIAFTYMSEECLVLLYTSATWALKLHHFKNFLNIMMNFRRSCFAPTITHRASPSELELRALFAEKHITLRALYCIRGHDELAKLANELICSLFHSRRFIYLHRTCF